MSDDNPEPKPAPQEESPPVLSVSVSPSPPQQPVAVDSCAEAKVKEEAELPPPKKRLSEILKSESSTSAEKDEPSPAVDALAAEPEAKKMTEEVTSPAPVVLAEKGQGSLEEPPAAAEVSVVSSGTQGTVAESEKGKEKRTEEGKIPESLVSFKEESNMVADLSDFERKALQELKQMVEDALKSHLFTSTHKPSSEFAKSGGPGSEWDATTKKDKPQEPKMEEETVREGNDVDEVSIWGIPLLKDDRSVVILLKFLRAREFKVKDAFLMLKNTIQWRKEFGIDELLDEDLGDDLEKVVFMHGYDRDGHPVCYNVYGEFQNGELYQKTFGDEEKREKFLRWRIQFLERSIRKLDFSPGGINTIFQVNDLKNSPGPGKREHRLSTRQAMQILQDNYPEFVAKQVFINVPWWYLAFYTMISPFLTQRTKSKFVFAGPSKTAETLFKYMSPEQVPVQYGGLSVDYCDCKPEFTIADPATEMTVKPATKQTVEIIIYEKCVLVWELRVVGWEVSYAAEFVPNDKHAYAMLIQKPTKMAPTDEPVVSNSFRVSELGKLLITIDNSTSKKKKFLYRFKVNPLNG